MLPKLDGPRRHNDHFIKMCGIWGFLGNHPNYVELFDAYNNIRNRGPSRSEFVQIASILPIYFGFHRLPIVEDTANGDQPFTWEEGGRRVYVGVNGEIYNHKQLIKEHELTPQTPSDCEVILWLYLKYGIEKVCDLISGEYVFFIFDFNLKGSEVLVHLGRDQCGIRPLFYSITDEYLAFSSEAKGLTCHFDKSPQQIASQVKVFPPRHRLEARVTLNSQSDRKVITTEQAIRVNEKLMSDPNCVIEDSKHTIHENGQQVKRKHSFNDREASKPLDRNLFSIDHKLIPIYSLQQHDILITDEKEAMEKIRKVLTECVEERMHCYAPLGCLLSGGLDSSLVSAIAAKEFKKQGRRLRTFSIGMPGSTDKQFAEMVAKYIDSDHIHVEFSEEDFLAALRNVIKCTETFDITTIRATTGQYLISKWIRDNTDIKVLLIGDGSDELCCGYMYFHNSPDPLSSHKENIRLLENIHLYDVLRADRAVAGNGLEARVPFLDKKFIELYLSIDPKLRVPRETPFANGRKLEKYLLRESFQDTGLLPNEVLYRKKEAFSDGVSSVDKSWYMIIQQWANAEISDADFEDSVKEYTHLPPISKESLYYRRMFEQIFGKGDICSIVPDFWLPLWSANVKDPSARVLNVYHKDNEVKS